MIEGRKEQLYTILFDVMTELTEYESSELIFDRIVEDFAMSAEYHMGQADTFNSMLNTFRHNNPMETIPEVSEATETPETAMYDAPELNWDSVLEQTDPRKRALMSADSDAFKAFIDQMNFPG
jgi:hypothetical protein